jgi:hypothetical protein
MLMLGDVERACPTQRSPVAPRRARRAGRDRDGAARHRVAAPGGGDASAVAASKAFERLKKLLGGEGYTPG